MSVIAIDGTFASGKGTLARKLAAHYGFACLDTGKIYRAVAAKALNSHTSLEDAKACAQLAATLTLSDLDNPELKSGTIGAAASKIAVHAEVRKALLAFQKDFAKNPGKNVKGKNFKGAILDGRDIGTVICPDADVKLYIDAAPDVRAQRRHSELTGYGEDIIYEDVLAQLIERDHRDMNRTEAPLKPAANAHLLDTTNLAIDAAFEMAISIIDAVLRST
ncbi:MAG: cytidylate kinase [Robiginitomaculum sp.]|nr:MAG: cytidylate kinase [Robiginitomaculum sp.]